MGDNDEVTIEHPRDEGMYVFTYSTAEHGVTSLRVMDKKFKVPPKSATMIVREKTNYFHIIRQDGEGFLVEQGVPTRLYPWAGDILVDYNGDGGVLTLDDVGLSTFRLPNGIKYPVYDTCVEEAVAVRRYGTILCIVGSTGQVAFIDMLDFRVLSVVQMETPLEYRCVFLAKEDMFGRISVTQMSKPMPGSSLSMNYNFTSFHLIPGWWSGKKVSRYLMSKFVSAVYRVRGFFR